MADKKDLTWHDAPGKCPKCGKETIQGKLDRGGDTIHYNCKSCNATWQGTTEDAQRAGDNKKENSDSGNGPGGNDDLQDLDPSLT